MTEKRAPLPGRIIAEAGSGGRVPPFAEGAAAVVDAEFEMLGPTDRQNTPAHTFPATDASRPSGLDTLRSGPQRRAGKSSAGKPGAVSVGQRPPVSGRALFWAVGAVLVAGAFWTSGGHTVLGKADAARQPPSHLRIADLATRLEKANGRTLLLVDGAAVNDGRGTQALPDLAINVLKGNGHTMHYFLGTMGRPLAAGERFAFSGRLVAPKEGVQSVSVTFRESR